MLYHKTKLNEVPKLTLIAKFGLTVACCPVGLGNEPGQSSSLTWPGNVCNVGVDGLKLADVGPTNEELEANDSSSL